MLLTCRVKGGFPLPFSIHCGYPQEAEVLGGFPRGLADGLTIIPHHLASCWSGSYHPQFRLWTGDGYLLLWTEASGCSGLRRSKSSLQAIFFNPDTVSPSNMVFNICGGMRGLTGVYLFSPSGHRAIISTQRSITQWCWTVSHSSIIRIIPFSPLHGHTAANE